MVLTLSDAVLILSDAVLILSDAGWRGSTESSEAVETVSEERLLQDTGSFKVHYMYESNKEYYLSIIITCIHAPEAAHFS